MESGYDDLYRRGLNRSWTEARKARIVEVLGALPLPGAGTALDFGCGCGALTPTLAGALPGWTVRGAEVGPEALRAARGDPAAAGLSFFSLAETEAGGSRFDLIFTHHVLEHVEDPEAEIDRMLRLLAPGGWMLHVLPCGNSGSLEHALCAAQMGGIDDAGRFRFEDPAHRRRWTSDSLSARFSARGCEPGLARFRNQEAGAVEWLTVSPPEVIRALADPARAVDGRAARLLARWRRRLLAIRWLREIDRRRMRLAASPRGAGSRARLALSLPFAWLGRWTDRTWREAAEREWRERATDPAGSEMFLAFRR